MRIFPDFSMSIPSSRRLLSFATFLVLCLSSSLSLSQTRPPNALKTVDIIAYLMQTISWYRGTAVQQQVANELSDLTFLNENRAISGQIVRLAFDFARLEEKNESVQFRGNQTQDQSATPSQYQLLRETAAKVDQQVEQLQKELQSLRQKLETTPEKKRPALESLIAETQSELAFHQARHDALSNLLRFTPGTGTRGMGAAGLRAQIEELERSVPAALSGADETSREKSTAIQTAERTSLAENKIRRSRPELIVAVGVGALLKVKVIKDIPIVYLMIPDPRSLLSEEENITGTACVPPLKGNWPS
jgi:hypothetical protein